jgi:hypothetical protein
MQLDRYPTGDRRHQKAEEDESKLSDKIDNINEDIETQ